MRDSLENFVKLADFKLFEIGGTPITVATIATAIVIMLMTFVASRLVRRAVRLGFERRGIEADGTMAAINRLIHYVVLFIGLGIAVQTAGINLSTLFAAGAVFAVGIGFAMQNIAQNFVSGVILLVERAIKPGDVLEVGGQIVQVRKMGIRSALVHGRDGEDIIVPNSTLVQGHVTNFTLRDSVYRVRVGVGVTYDTDMEKVRSVLEEVGESFDAKWGIRDRDVQVLMTGFGDNSVNWEIGIWMNDPWSERDVLSSIHEAVWFALKKAGIVIAFPQLDVHFDPPVSNGFSRLAAAG